jgi:diacylglycerol kinase (ATP)
MDIGKISFTDFDDQPQVRYFISESQLGIGSVIAEKIRNGHKFLGGKMAFGYISLKQALVFESQPLKVTVDKKTVYLNSYLGIAIGNGSQTAGGMLLTPEARPNDGFLDILFIHKMGILNRLINFPKIYSGNHIYSPLFTYIKGKNIEIESDGYFTVSADGEFLGKTPCFLTILPAALKLKSPYNSSITI